MWSTCKLLIGQGAILQTFGITLWGYGIPRLPLTIASGDGGIHYSFSSMVWEYDG